MLLSRILAAPSQQFNYYTPFLFTNKISLIVMIVILSLYLMQYGLNKIKMYRLNHSLIYDIEIHIEKDILKCKMFLDTGNELLSPEWTPVLICNKKLIQKKILSFDFSKFDHYQSLSQRIDALNLAYPSRFCQIPFSSVNGTTAAVEGLYTDYAILWANQKTIKINRLLIGLDAKTFQNKPYDCIGGLRMLKE